MRRKITVPKVSPRPPQLTPQYTGPAQLTARAADLDRGELRCCHRLTAPVEIVSQHTLQSAPGAEVNATEAAQGRGHARGAEVAEPSLEERIAAARASLSPAEDR